MKEQVTLTTRKGRIGNKDMLEIELKMNEERVRLSQHIYETIDKAILENMPDDILITLSIQIQAEITRRSL